MRIKKADKRIVTPVYIEDNKWQIKDKLIILYNLTDTELDDKDRINIVKSLVKNKMLTKKCNKLDALKLLITEFRIKKEERKRVV